MVLASEEMRIKCYTIKKILIKFDGFTDGK